MLSSSLKEAFPLPKQALQTLSKDYRILPVASIYGANASGKSNLLTGLSFMKWFVLNSFTPGPIDSPIPVDPFLFSTETEKEPSELEVTFVIGEAVYRYGFEVTRKSVTSEWLYQKELKPRSKEKEIFYRENDEFQYHATLFKVGKVIKEQNLAKHNVLLITLAFQLNDEMAGSVIMWFGKLHTLQGHKEEEFQNFSKEQILERTPLSNKIENLVRFADTNIEKISGTTVDGEVQITTSHIVYDEKNRPSGFKEMHLNREESAGTQKLFNLAGPILHALNHWNVLVIDEMDAKLHPNLMEKLILMFQDQQINKKGAQLIFATHNTNVLDVKLLRRDQVWITEKDMFGATHLYSIADYKTDKGKARNTEALEQNYIQGKYGGVPFLGDLENFLEDFVHE